MAFFARTSALLSVMVSTASLFAQEPAKLPAIPPDPQPAPVVPLNCPVCDPKPALPPYGGPLCERGYLSGDWFGCRDCARDNGFTIDASSTNFYQGVVSGGTKDNFQYGGRFDLLVNIDGEKAGLWKGLFITLHDETLYGNSVNGNTGAISPVSLGQTVPVAKGPVNALTGVMVTQALSEQFVLFGGKINTLDAFNQPFAGFRGVTGFMNMSLDFPVVAARTIPYSTYGGGFSVLKDLQPVITVMVLDTNNTPTTTGFPTFFDNGTTVVGLANLPVNFLGLPGHQGVGGSYSNRAYSDLDNLPYLIIQSIRPNLPPAPQVTGSWNVFYMFDQALGTVCCDPKRTWGVFGNAGISDGNPNPIRWSANIGLGGSVPFSSRPLDSFGVGYYYLGLSDSLKTAAPNVLPLSDEYGVETYYTVGVTPWCHITTDLQVVNPTRSRVDTAVVFGIRAKIDF